MKKKIAVIGSGISGITAAFELHKKYEVHIYEKNSYLGGHTHTHKINEDGKKYFIDSGFIVFNNKTYPNFINFLNKLKIKSENTNMSFSVNYPHENFEWSGKNFKSVIIKNEHFFSIKFFRILTGIIKFNFLAKINRDSFLKLKINTFLKKFNFTEEFKRYYLYPMCASIWSNPINKVKNYKTGFLIKFFINHGLVNIFFRPQWKVIKFGSNKYIQKIKNITNIKFFLNSNIKSIKILKDKVGIKIHNKIINYNYIIFANHSNEIIKILPNNLKKQKKVLGLVKY
ncbi:MAG: NAD(P)-binding protein, partial [Pseudomonadota bacterium]